MFSVIFNEAVTLTFLTVYSKPNQNIPMKRVTCNKNNIANIAKIFIYN